MNEETLATEITEDTERKAIGVVRLHRRAHSCLSLCPLVISVANAWSSTGTVMPFEKVDTQVDFPAQERAVLEFWDRIGAFEALREKNRGGPRWSFLDGPDHGQQPDGRSPRLGPHLQGRLPALPRHERPRPALPERLRLPGPLGRGRGREGAEARSPSATSRTSFPATRRQHRPIRAALQAARGQVRRASRRSSRSASATGWTGTATTTGRSRRTSGAATSRCRRRTTTRSGAF